MSFGRPYILKIDGAVHDGWLILSNYNKVFDVYTISQFVKIDNRKMIMIVNLIRKFNKTYFDYVGLISEYDFK